MQSLLPSLRLCYTFVTKGLTRRASEGVTPLLARVGLVSHSLSLYYTKVYNSRLAHSSPSHPDFPRCFRPIGLGSGVFSVLRSPPGTTTAAKDSRLPDVCTPVGRPIPGKALFSSSQAQRAQGSGHLIRLPRNVGRESSREPAGGVARETDIPRRISPAQQPPMPAPSPLHVRRVKAFPLGARQGTGGRLSPCGSAAESSRRC